MPDPETLTRQHREVLRVLSDLGGYQLAGAVGLRALPHPGTQKQAAHRILPALGHLERHGFVERHEIKKRAIWGLSKAGERAVLGSMGL